jgi:hypothetical protein
MCTHPLSLLENTISLVDKSHLSEHRPRLLPTLAKLPLAKLQLSLEPLSLVILRLALLQQAKLQQAKLQQAMSTSCPSVVLQTTERSRVPRMMH